MKTAYFIFLSTFLFVISCTPQNKKAPQTSDPSLDDWIIDSQDDWHANTAHQSNLKFTEGKATPTSKESSFRSVIKNFPKKQSIQSITVSQSPDWLNWQPVSNIGPSNLGDAPIALQLGEGNYWMFGRYQQNQSQKEGTFIAKDVTIEGLDLDLKSSPYPNQFDAPGGLKPHLGGYHAWHSKDMKTWIHHGTVSEGFSRWMTSAEYVDGRFYLYYDFPNDQDPHLYIDEDLTDGVPGKNMGIAFNDPSDGSDCAVIRDLEGNFHIIAEDWSPINASTHAWDSPLAVHGISTDGIGDFKIVNPPVDERTRPTGKFAEYSHPHWHQEDPKRFPGKKMSTDVPQHKMKAGDIRAFATYEIHDPEQNAFGDWASISVGGQYYLFADYDPAGKHGRDNMSVAWFTASDINQPFTFCGNIGQGHPDPDILFAENQFYLITQMDTDYTSPGPWVEIVKARVGVDTNNDGTINQWSDWQEVIERYSPMEGFAKQIRKAPAQLDLSNLPEGFGFQFEIEITDTTDNQSKPILDKVALAFKKR